MGLKYIKHFLNLLGKSAVCALLLPPARDLLTMSSKSTGNVWTTCSFLAESADTLPMEAIYPPECPYFKSKKTFSSA